MIISKLLFYEFKHLKINTVLIIGQLDRIVVGKVKVSKDLLNKFGQYPELGRKTAKLIKNFRLVEIKGVGHIPHIEKTEVFRQKLLKVLN